MKFPDQPRPSLLVPIGPAPLLPPSPLILVLSKGSLLPLSLLLLFLLPSRPAQAQAQPDTLTRIRQINLLTCGIDQSEAEYSATDEHGPRVAFDQDLCRAVAAAILGPAPHVAYKGYPDDETAAAALRKGEIDLIPTLSADFTHATDPTLTQTRPILEDLVTLLVAAREHITQASQLADRKICFLAETEAETALQDYFGQHFLPFPFQEQGEMEAAYTTHNCTALAGDITRLATVRASLTRNPGDYLLLPEHLAEDPLALTTRAADPDLSRIVAAVLNVLLAAAQQNLTQGDLIPHTQAARRLLGQTHELGRPLHLPEDWPRIVLQTTGNYTEIATRTLTFHPPPPPQAIPFK